MPNPTPKLAVEDSSPLDLGPEFGCGLAAVLPFFAAEDQLTHCGHIGLYHVMHCASDAMYQWLELCFLRHSHRKTYNNYVFCDVFTF